jgi:hypothetical protein
LSTYQETNVKADALSQGRNSISVWTATDGNSTIISATEGFFPNMIDMCLQFHGTNISGPSGQSLDIRSTSKQAYVAASCASQPSSFSIDNSSAPMTFYGSDNQFEVNITIGQYLTSFKSSNGTNITWLDPPAQHRDNYSVLAIVPWADWDDGSVAWFCSFRSAWITSSINSTEENFYISGRPDNITYVKTPSQWQEPLIAIEAEWVQNAIKSAEFPEPSLNSMINEFYEPDTLLATLLATAISTVTPGQMYVYPTAGHNYTSIISILYGWLPHNSSLPSFGTPGAENSIFIDLWLSSSTGYSVQSVSTILAATILMVYCAYVCGFIFYSLYSGISSSSWDSITDIVALALTSTPPSHLGAVSAGVETLKVYQEPISILANPDDNLEIVFLSEDKDMTGFTPVEKNKAY